MKNIGAAMAGGNGKRRAHDFYPTPWEATAALMNEFGSELGDVIWEPACGDGMMADVIKAYGKTVVATDLVDRFYGESGFDFLKERRLPTAAPLVDAIITNPPFNLAVPFIERAIGTAPKVAMLLKATFWNANARRELARKHPPAVIAPCCFRMDVTGQGRPTMDVTWFLWGVEPRPITLLLKPKQDPRSA